MNSIFGLPRVLALVAFLALAWALAFSPCHAQNQTEAATEQPATESHQDAAYRLSADAVLSIVYCADSVGEYRPCPS